MKNSKHSHDIVRQNDDSVKKSHKHDANLQKNSTLYFQVGLIVCLLAALGLLEMRFETTIPQLAQDTLELDETFEMEAPNFEVYEEPKEEVKPKTKKVMLIDEPIIVENIPTIEETLNIETPNNATPNAPFDPNSVDVPTIDVAPVIEFINVEQVPIYPGCEKKKGNNAKKKCMSDKITRLVQRRFNGGDIASQYGLSGKQRITVQFQIDKTGKVTDIQTYAPHPKLGDEAKRVVNKIPEMQPGIQRDKPVGVRYTLPIIFQAQ